METNKINYITIQQYLDGTLDKEAMHDLEREALNDPFLADALEGYSYTKKPVAPQLSLLQMQLEQRIAQHQENKNVLNFSWQRLSIAAAAGLLFVTATILLWMKTHHAEQQLARQPRTVEVTLTPVDSADNKTALADKHQEEKVEVTVTPKKQESSARELPKRKQASNQTAEVETDKTEAAVQSLSKSELNEVTIIGYGTQKRSSLTGSISTVSGLSTQSSSSFLSGRVVTKSGEPLPGASVRVRGSALGTTTNAQGEFVLNDSLGRVLDVRFIGYKPEKVRAKPGDSIIIALKEDESSLNEVVVIGYGGTPKLLEFSEPVKGWKYYNDYIKQNLEMPTPPVKGAVVVAFVINANNEPTNFMIKRGLSEAANNEAIRLIKEGPAWLRGQDSTVRVTVRFKK